MDKEEIKVSGEQLVKKVKQLIKEGNARRIILKNEEGEKLMEIPLTIGVVGTLAAPVWAALGALAALLTSCTLVVVKADPKKKAKKAAKTSAPKKKK